MLCKSLKLRYTSVVRYPSFQSFGLTTLGKRSDLEIPCLSSSRYTRVRYTSADRLVVPFSSFREADNIEGEPLAKNMTNRLATEESPYLLQHQHNPVQWYPWGNDAFEEARRRDCPIFLSIGYSTCHWCHVMEKESFENRGIADILNENFVSIKVDKEERPDVDRLYMTYIQATQGSGGWPMSIFLTPDTLAPFFGGTYFPPNDIGGRPGFATVLNRISQVWGERKQVIRQSSEETMSQLADFISSEGKAPVLLEVEERNKAIEDCSESLRRRFDSKLGGFGVAPKFPRPSEIMLLFTQHLRQVDPDTNSSKTTENVNNTDKSSILNMATFTLEKMANGGMRDHLGGGFHRYSVDELWHVPHFEIMLYDQPQLVEAYLTAYQLTSKNEFAFVARGLLDYLARDLRHPDGSFYAAEDADSLDPSDNEKKEGFFYAWTEREVNELLSENGGDDAILEAFKYTYGVKPNGNCTMSPRSDPHGEFIGKNVLIRLANIEDTAAMLNTSEGQAEEILAACREKLFQQRLHRPRPHRDEKIVAAWNGMAIGAFAVAGRVLMNEDPPIERMFPVEGRDPREYIEIAEQASADIHDKLYHVESNRLKRSFMRHPSAVNAFSDDYAQMISGLLDLYAVTGNIKHLKWAMDLQRAMDEEFWDDVGGGYFQSSGEDKSVKLRMKEDYDGAEVAASSTAVANLWRLASLSGTERAGVLRSQAEKCASAFRARLREAPLALPHMCRSLYLLNVGYARQVIVAGKRGATDTEALIQATFTTFAPDSVIIHLDLGDSECVNFWRQYNPEVLSMVERSGMTPSDPATCFICFNFTCRAPTKNPEDVQKLMLQSHTAAPSVSKVNVTLDKLQ